MSYHPFDIDSIYGIRGWDIEDKVNWKFENLKRDEIKKEKLKRERERGIWVSSHGYETDRIVVYNGHILGCSFYLPFILCLLIKKEHMGWSQRNCFWERNNSKQTYKMRSIER